MFPQSTPPGGQKQMSYTIGLKIVCFAIVGIAQHFIEITLEFGQQ